MVFFELVWLLQAVINMSGLGSRQGVTWLEVALSQVAPVLGWA